MPDFYAWEAACLAARRPRVHAVTVCAASSHGADGQPDGHILPGDRNTAAVCGLKVGQGARTIRIAPTIVQLSSVAAVGVLQPEEAIRQLARLAATQRLRTVRHLQLHRAAELTDLPRCALCERGLEAMSRGRSSERYQYRDRPALAPMQEWKDDLPLWPHPDQVALTTTPCAALWPLYYRYRLDWSDPHWNLQGFRGPGPKRIEVYWLPGTEWMPAGGAVRLPENSTIGPLPEDAVPAMRGEVLPPTGPPSLNATPTGVYVCWVADVPGNTASVALADPSISNNSLWQVPLVDWHGQYESARYAPIPGAGPDLAEALRQREVAESRTAARTIWQARREAGNAEVLAADENSTRLLVETLGPELAAFYAQHGYVDVESRLFEGRGYRIRPWRRVGVLERKCYEWEERRLSYCIHPDELHPQADEVVALWLGLRFNELELIVHTANLHQEAA